MPPQKSFGKKKFGDKKFGDKKPYGAPAMGADGKPGPKLLGKPYFQRKKSCPFSGPKAPSIDYKDVRLLSRYISDFGKILPRHLTGVSAKKQRELVIAIKRARILALLPFSVR
jgi:small subunit ribosomal protein S18